MSGCCPFRWWWQPATLTAPPSASLSPGLAICCSALLWVPARRTTIILPLLLLLLLHLSKPRRSWAKALARGRPRKLSRTSCWWKWIWLVLLPSNFLVPLIRKGTVWSLSWWGPFYLRNLVFFAFFTWFWTVKTKANVSLDILNLCISEAHLHLRSALWWSIDGSGVW